MFIALIALVVDDDSGPMAVDPRQGMDVELDKSFEQEQNDSYGDVHFGEFHTHVPHAGGDKHGHGVKVIEKIVPIQGGMFVVGQLANQTITKPSGMLGTLRASRKGTCRAARRDEAQHAHRLHRRRPLPSRSRRPARSRSTADRRAARRSP